MKTFKDGTGFESVLAFLWADFRSRYSYKVYCNKYHRCLSVYPYKGLSIKYCCVCIYSLILKLRKALRALTPYCICEHVKLKGYLYFCGAWNTKHGDREESNKQPIWDAFGAGGVGYSAHICVRKVERDGGDGRHDFQRYQTSCKVTNTILCWSSQ